MPDELMPPLETSEDYNKLIAKQTDFKDQVQAILLSRFPSVVRDQPRGRHNADFIIKEDFFGYEREWVVVTHSSGNLFSYERAVRVVGSFKEEIERHDVHGVLVITDRGIEKFAEDFLANNVGFLHRTLQNLQSAPANPGAFIQSGTILRVDMSSPDYDKALTGIEATSNTLKGDNQLSLPGALKQRLIQELEAAATLLKSTEIQAELVVNFILKLLKGIADKLGTYAVSASAVAALEAVIRLLHLGH